MTAPTELKTWYTGSPLEIAFGQYEMFEEIADCIAGELDAQQMVIRGCIWKSLKKWQDDAHLPAAQLRQMSPEERLDRAQEIAALIRSSVSHTLSQTDPERIGDAVGKALTLYREKFAHREYPESV